ncbi:TonB-dependent receptor [Novosphingobium olei]|uniref:TonB-dependent receptor n=1 Tax=Novosphingobium olei TaxID=2728851 RepID=A0A7Y0GBS5_9SPHN|nr:TonB-dependent receptor [Novosphingobium olei]NML94942.1 TonB-dependent receptor [Novosphingobium olei]
MKLIKTACLVSAIALSAPAYAQDAAQTTAQQSADAVPTGDIVVTATRQSTLLSKTPITLSAITGDGLKSSGITDARALTTAIPNLALTESGDAVRISIRGVTSTDTTEKGDPSAAFLLDGIYIARPADTLGSFYDVERVEVLRGPQGTLYGRNTTAGVINVIANRPVDAFHASVDASYGNLNTVDASAMVNVGLGNGLGIRAAANYQRQDPYYTVEGASSRLNPFRDVLSGRLSFGGETGNLKFVIRGDYTQTRGTGTNGNLVTLDRFFDPATVTPTNNPVYVNRSSDEQRLLTVNPTYRNWRNNKAYGIMGEFTYDFGPVQLTYLGSYRKTDRDDTRNLLLFSALNNPAFFFGHFKQDSHELRLAFGQGSPLHGQVGGYYFHEKSDLEFNLGAPLSSLVVAGATGFAFPQGPTVSRSKAVFGQVTYDLTSDLHVTGGVRYTNDFKSRNGATVVDFPTVASSFCGALRCTLNENIAKKTWNKTIWKVGVDYDAPGLGLFYANVSTGYKAGGFNDGCVTGSGVGCSLTADALYYNPENLTSYEVGAKLRFSNAFRLNASLFHYDYDKLQVSQVVTVPIPATLISNAAKAKVDGLELEATLQPGDNDRFDLGYTYTNSRYTNFTPNPVAYPSFNFNGALLDHAPKHVATAAWTHTIVLGDAGKLDLGVRSRLSSEYFILDLNNLSQFRQPAFTKTDATITYTAPNDRFYVQGFVKNIEDNITIAHAASGLGAGVTIEAPRTYGVRAGVKF